MRLDVAEYGVRSAVETTAAVVKLAFELSLVCETREVEVLESCVNEVSVRRVKSLLWRKDVTSSVPLGRCVCRLELR